MTTGRYSGDCAVGLDVGTTKICAVIGRHEAGGIKIVSLGASRSLGLRKGIVFDMDLTAVSIQEALRDAENSSGLKVRSVIVGIAGGHIKGFNGYGAIGLRSGPVGEEDVERLIDSAGAVCVPVDREILHVISSGFRIDGNNGIVDPVGMSGDRLEAKVHIVTGSVASVRNLIKCCETARVEVDDIVLEPLASADAVLHDEEREKGVALIDIGGGTTDIAVYKEGILRHTAVLALGGNHITNDLAIGLGVSFEEAERIKKGYGLAMAGMTEEREEIAAKSADGQTLKIPRRHLREIIEPRCEEIMTLAGKEIGSGERGFSGDEGSSLFFSGVVLTGGTSLLNGIDLLAESVLGLPVRIGIPEGVVNGELVRSPEYATGVGLVRYGLGCREEPEILPLTSGGIFERMKYWVKGYFI